jgi:hypothetical protein
MRAQDRGVLRRLFFLAVLLVLALPASSAMAGRLIVTGHDADLHCAGGQGCHFITVAVGWVRAAAPNPNKPVLILDRDPSGGTTYQMEMALDLAFSPGSVPRVVMDPRSAEFATAPLTTNDYSAILVASDTTCGGCDLNSTETGDPNATPDSDAINARAKDIAAFFNAGGGVFAASGAGHGDGDPSDGAETYYKFVPLPLGGHQVSPPFTLTPAGQALGFQDDPAAPDSSDINCCATHNSFEEPPSGSPLTVAERDSSTNPSTGAPVNAPVTLFAEGTISGNTIVEPGAPPPPVEGKTVNVTPVSGTVLVKKRHGGFVPLSEAKQIPMGSTLDTTHGVVKLDSATGKLGTTQTGNFNGGQFRVTQTKKNPLTQLTMGGGGFGSCKTRVPRGGSAARTHRRRLFGNAHGRFRTRGRNSSATVRGTKWTMTDTCAGTLTSVQRGVVVVRDFTLRKNKTVKAGHRYFAHAPKLRRVKH